MINKHEMQKNEDKACNLCCTQIVNFGVKRGGNVILNDVNIHIHCGELTAVVGPNGAGKSTLLKAILGEIKHTGELTFLDAKGLHSGKPIIGYVPQQLSFDRSSPVSVIDFFSAFKSRRPVWFSHSGNTRKRVKEALEGFHIEYAIDRRLGDLSGGELQRVLLALAMDPLPDILLLDEPVSGVDHKGMEMFYRTVSELRENYDLTIILVSHDLHLVARYADRVVLLNKTVECNGTAEEVFRNSKFTEIFGDVLPPKSID